MLAKLDPPGKHGAKRLDIDYKLVSELGYAAAILGCRQVAVKCAQRAQAAQDLVPRLRSDLTVCLLELQDVKTAEERKGPNDGPPPGPGALSLASEVLTTRAVNFRVQIIKKLEQVGFLARCCMQCALMVGLSVFLFYIYTRYHFLSLRQPSLLSPHILIPTHTPHPRRSLKSLY